RPRPHPWAGRPPGDDLRDERRRPLGQAPPRTRRPTPAPLAPAGHQERGLAGGTAQAETAGRQEAAPPRGGTLPLDRGRHARGLCLSLARGEPGLQGRRAHGVAPRVAGRPGGVGGPGWCQTRPHGQEGKDGKARSGSLRYGSHVQSTRQICPEDTEETRGTPHWAPVPPRCVVHAVVAQVRLKFLYTPGGSGHTPLPLEWRSAVAASARIDVSVGLREMCVRTGRYHRRTEGTSESSGSAGGAMMVCSVSARARPHM